MATETAIAAAGLSSPTLSVASEASEDSRCRVEAEILGFEVVRRTYARYVVLLTAPARRWKQRRRFQDFNAFYIALRREAPHKAWPTLPPKRFFLFQASKFEPEFLEDRAVQLERFLRGVLAVPGALECEAVREFLDITDFALNPAAARNLRMIFDVLDGKGADDGQLNRNQVKEAVGMLGVRISSAVLDMAMQEMDMSGSGKISWDEFKAIGMVCDHALGDDEVDEAESRAKVKDEEKYRTPPRRTSLAYHLISPAARRSRTKRCQEPAVLFTSSTNASVCAEAEERRIKHILATKNVRYEIVYLDITIWRRKEMNDAITSTCGMAVQSFEGKGMLQAPIPRLVVNGKDVGGYAEIQALEDDGLLDAELQGLPHGEPFWVPPDDWINEEQVSEEDQLLKVFHRLGADGGYTVSDSLTPEGITSAMALMGMTPASSPRSDAPSMQLWEAGSFSSSTPGKEDAERAFGYEDFFVWYEERNERKLFAYLDDDGKGALGVGDIREASRILGGELSDAEIETILTDLGRDEERDSVDVLEFVAWWTKNKVVSEDQSPGPYQNLEGPVSSDM